MSSETAPLAPSPVPLKIQVDNPQYDQLADLFEQYPGKDSSTLAEAFTPGAGWHALGKYLMISYILVDESGKPVSPSAKILDDFRRAALSVLRDHSSENPSKKEESDDELDFMSGEDSPEGESPPDEESSGDGPRLPHYTSDTERFRVEELRKAAEAARKEAEGTASS